MRLSRKAGLLACGIRWVKYACTRTGTQDGYEAGYTSEYKYGQDPSAWFQGTPGFQIVWDGTQYVYQAVGDSKHVDVDNPGAVYQVNGTTMECYTVSSNGLYTIEIRTLMTLPHYVYEYSVGDKIGYVYAAEDEYPDAKKGYTYITTNDDEYVIMKDSDGNFYAYSLTAPSPGSLNGEFSTIIEDDVLTITGDGTATISDDGVLTVTGRAGASVSNNILYVR